MSRVPPSGASSDDSTEVPGSTSWRSVPAGSLQWLRVYHLLFSRVPLRLAYVFILPVVFTWFLHYNRPRRAVVRAMRRFGRRFPSLAALRTYLQFAFSLVDRHYLVAGRISLKMVDEYEEAGRSSPVVEALASSERVILLGSHFGTLQHERRGGSITWLNTVGRCNAF